MVEETAEVHTGEPCSKCVQCDELMAYVFDLIGKTKDVNVSGELCYILTVLPELRKKGDDAALDIARLSIKSLSLQPPNLELAKALNKKIKKNLSWLASISAMLSSSKSSSNYVLLGLGVFLYIGIPLTAVAYEYMAYEYVQVLGINLYTFFTVFTFGALGSIVSILSRIKDYAESTEKDISVLFYTGLFKPVIGSAFALFVYALVEAKLFPIAITKETELFIYISLSFLSGFSERFTNDVISKAEGVVAKTA